MWVTDWECGSLVTNYPRAATTPGPSPQPHGWVRLGIEVSRFPHFWRGGGDGMCQLSQGCGVSGLFSSIFFSTSLNKKKKKEKEKTSTSPKNSGLKCLS